MGTENRQVHVFIVSDATGATAERVINAALVQFEGIDPVFEKFPFVNTPEQMADILARAQGLDAIVIYSLVSEEIRQWINEQKHRYRIYLIDLLGPILKNLERLWDIIPKLRPGILGEVGEDTYRLAESIDFTLKHDDGQNIDTIGKADLILLGVSRTSKTPTSLYLACNHNLKVANVPIIKDVPLSDKITEVHAPIVGLTIEAKKLALIRGSRLLYTGSSAYADIDAIREEILYCNKIYRKIKRLQTIDVSHRPIEEIAKGILQTTRMF